MSHQISSEPIPVPGHSGFMPFPRRRRTGDELVLEPSFRLRFLILFLVVSGFIFGTLALMLLALVALSETFREHRGPLLQLFLLVAPALGFFLATLLNRTLGALWGTTGFDRASDLIWRRRWRDGFQAPLSSWIALQVCRERDGRLQLNAVFRNDDGSSRRFLFHHGDAARLRALAEELSEEFGITLIDNG